MSNQAKFAFFTGGFMAGVLIVLAILIAGWALLPFILPTVAPIPTGTPTSIPTATPPLAPTPTHIIPATRTATIAPTNTLVVQPPTDTPTVIALPTLTPTVPPTDTPFVIILTHIPQFACAFFVIFLMERINRGASR
jgi:hypothetical protein